MDAATGKPRSGAAPLPWIVLATALGVLLCAIANAFSRAEVEPAMAFYWVGMLVLALPIFYRLTAADATARERLLLVCLLGLALYLVKVMRDAPMFTFADELVHGYNAERIAETNRLFEPNPILEATPSFPGLEGAATALTQLTGVSLFAAGTILVGIARVVLMAALFFLFARVSGSDRVAGLGAAIYVGNFNFLFWSAQFSYESLALPLMLLALMAVAEREKGAREALRAWLIPVLLAAAAVIVTHHLSSYALVIALAALALSYRGLRGSWRSPNPWPLAIACGLAALAWLFVVASTVVGYLTPVLSNAFEAVFNTIGGVEESRGLFENEATTVPPTPIGARATALLGVVALAAALPFGLWETWRRYRREPFAAIFALAALGLFATLAMRLTPPAWETANRASEFLFVGLAFVAGLAALALLRRWSGAPARAALAAAICLVVTGGAITGWPWDSQLAKPLRISADGATISSPPLSFAEWARRTVRGGRFAASTADAGLLMTPGQKFAMAGVHPDIEDILDTEFLESWELPLLRENRLRYVVADNRLISADALRGYYFTRPESLAAQRKARSTTAKFALVPGAARIYSNGSITLFDLRGRR